MRILFYILLGLFLSVTSSANAQFFKAGGKYYCINYKFKLQIVAKMAPKQYEVFFVDVMTGEGRGHMILYTDKSTFGSDGLVGNDLWVKTTMNDGDETIKLPTTNGFEKKFQVIRESAECEAKSKNLQGGRRKRKNKRGSRKAYPQS